MTYVLAPWRPRWRQPLRSPRETPRVGVLETSLHKIAYAALYRQREREREAENGRRNKEARRNGEQVEGGEIDTRVVCGSPRVEYVLPRGVGIIGPWAAAANGTGCFALVETADKSRKLNRRHRLSIGVPRGPTRRPQREPIYYFLHRIRENTNRREKEIYLDFGSISSLECISNLATKYFNSTIKMYRLYSNSNGFYLMQISEPYGS